jgi:two-component system chemotaxis response regulator CheY
MDRQPSSRGQAISSLGRCQKGGSVAARVLVVDDTSSIRFLLREVLPVHGFEVVAEATSADEGIEVAGREQPDFVILDMEMPRSNGIDAIEPIKAKAPNAKIVMYSSHDSDRVRDDALARGADAYLDKLAPMSEIAATMEKLWDNGDGDGSKSRG